MLGIDMDQPIKYAYATLRFFKEGEHHIARTCNFDVLILVYDGVLRFSEDGVEYEIHPGQYHIQRKGSVQSGERVSDAPKYLFVHFFGEWTDSETALPRSGNFDYAKLKSTIEELDTLSHLRVPYVLKTAKFYKLLSALYRERPTDSVDPTARKIADFISKQCHQVITLDMLCKKFHFSKNHIINIFKRSYNMTPIAYANQVRLEKAEYLMEVTSETLQSIARQCGFQNYSNFYKLFYHKNNLSPEKCREMQHYQLDRSISEITPHK